LSLPRDHKTGIDKQYNKGNGINLGAALFEK